MRARTFLAGTTLALLTAVWSAPAALAADPKPPGGDDSSPPSSSSSPEPSGNKNTDKNTDKSTEPPKPDVGRQPTPPIDPIPVEPKAVLSLLKGEARPGEGFGINATCTVGNGALSATRDVAFVGTGSGNLADNADAGDITITLRCVNGSKSAEATRILKVLPKAVPGPVVGGPVGGGPAAPGPVVPGPVVPGPAVPGPVVGGPVDKADKARLSVPDEVYPGDRFTVDAHCAQGRLGSLGAPGVRFQGMTGRVDDDAHEGKVIVTLRCPNDDVATDSLYVKKKYVGRPWLDLDPNSGKRGDRVDVRAYCPDSGGGRLESDGLDDIRLHRDGDLLRGETHVERDAGFGRTSGRLICDNGDRDWERFFVERDEHERYLDLDPGHGHRGDDVDVRVHCDRHLDKLESDILDDIELDQDGDHYWRFHGTTHVEKDADYGEHTIRIKCGDDWLEDDFFVQRDGDSGDGGEQSGLYPKGGVETGGGPVEGVPFGAVVLGLTGVLGAALAGAGAIAEGRGARR